MQYEALSPGNKVMAKVKVFVQANTRAYDISSPDIRPNSLKYMWQQHEQSMKDIKMGYKVVHVLCLTGTTKMTFCYSSSHSSTELY